MQVLTGMLSRCEETEVQLNSAKCLTYMYRSGALKGQDNSFIYMKVSFFFLCDHSSQACNIVISLVCCIPTGCNTMLSYGIDLFFGGGGLKVNLY